MRNISTPALVFAALMSASTVSLAQYNGPSSIPQATAKQLTDSGTDDQKAILRGKIVSHDGDNNYTFQDNTGKISVEISKRHFPANQPIGPDQQVELHGELDKDRHGIEFDVDQLRVL